MARRPVLLAGAALLALAACDEQPQRQQAQQPSQVAVDTSQTAQANEELLRAIRARPTTPGRLAPSEPQLLLDVPAGEEIRRVLTLTNRDGEDTRPVRIVSVSATGADEGLTLGGSCRAGAEVSPGLSCEIVVTYRDLTGRDRDMQILVRMENAREPQLEIPMRISVVQPPPPPPAPPPAPDAQAPQQPQGPDPRFLAALADAQARRFAAIQGQGQVMNPAATVAPPSEIARPTVGIRTHDQRYDPNNIPWTQATLRVDRRLILTADRVIHAHLETPISSLGCSPSSAPGAAVASGGDIDDPRRGRRWVDPAGLPNVSLNRGPLEPPEPRLGVQVIAVVANHVFSPDNVNVLIPRGTRVIGRCHQFDGERVAVFWHRMLTPTGINISFNMLLASSNDAQGIAGVPGVVRERAFDRYAAPIINSLIDLSSVFARAALGRDQELSVDPLTGRETRTRSRWDAAIDDFNDTARQTLQRSVGQQFDTRRAVVVPPGTRIEIQIQEDIYFRNPQEVVRLADFEYEISKSVQPPTAIQQDPPAITVAPRLDGARRQDVPNTVVIDGRRYVVQPGEAQQNLGLGAPLNQGNLQQGGVPQPPPLQPQPAPPPAAGQDLPPGARGSQGGWQGGGGGWQGGGGAWQGGR
jgi:hypothetical protein